MFSSTWTLNKDVYKTRQWNSYCCNNLHGKQCARWQVNRPITFMLASKRQAPRQFVKPPRLGHGSFMLKLKYFHLLWICCRLAVGLLWVQAFDLLYNLHNKATTNRSNGVWALITVYWLNSILVKTLTSFFCLTSRSTSGGKIFAGHSDLRRTCWIASVILKVAFCCPCQTFPIIWRTCRQYFTCVCLYFPLEFLNQNK